MGSRCFGAMLVAGLAACGPTPSADDEAVEPVITRSMVDDAITAARGNLLEPGMYRNEASGPDAPEPVELCLAAADIAQIDSHLFTGARADCAFESMTRTDHMVEVSMQCASEGERRAIDVTLRFARNGYRLASQSDGPDGSSLNHIIKARRIGDCANGEENAS